jgi:hypothetical protein
MPLVIVSQDRHYLVSIQRAQSALFRSLIWKSDVLNFAER